MARFCAQAQPIVYGLGAGLAALEGALDSRDPPLPLIVMSHGAFGAARDYGWIAEYLARHGFVVAGVSHFGESWIYGSSASESNWPRLEQLEAEAASDDSRRG